MAKKLKSMLYHPNRMLKGKRLYKAANELTRVELRPAIQGYKRQGQAIERQRQSAEAGLKGLGESTGAKVAGAYGALAGAGAQAHARQQALAGILNADTSRINNEAASNLQGMQTGALGGITEALSARNVDPGGSASQAALAQQAQAQQQAAARNAEARGAFASAQGGALTGQVANEALAGQHQGAERQADIASMIASRIAESNITHREAGLEALGKRKDAKALWGATRLKNLLSLRGSEREYDLARNPGVKRSIVDNRYSGSIGKTYKGLPGGAGSPKRGGGKKKKPRGPRK